MGSYPNYLSLVKLQSWFLNLHLYRTTTLVPAFAVEDLTLGRTL